MTVKVTIIGKDGHVYGDDEVVKVPREICQELYDKLIKLEKDKELMAKMKEVKTA